MQLFLNSRFSKKFYVTVDMVWLNYYFKFEYFPTSLWFAKLKMNLSLILRQDSPRSLFNPTIARLSARKFFYTSACTKKKEKKTKKVLKQFRSNALNVTSLQSRSRFILFVSWKYQGNPTRTPSAKCQASTRVTYS